MISYLFQVGCLSLVLLAQHIEVLITSEVQSML